jgi:hypothetical protein
MFNRGVVHIPQQYEPLLCQTLNSSGKQYKQPQQYEPLLCQTLNSNGQQRSGAYCCVCYSVAPYCLMFNRGVVHIVVAVYIVDHYCLMFNSGVVRQQYNRHNNMNHSSVKH